MYYCYKGKFTLHQKLNRKTSSENLSSEFNLFCDILSFISPPYVPCWKMLKTKKEIFQASNFPW